MRKPTSLLLTIGLVASLGDAPASADTSLESEAYRQLRAARVEPSTGVAVADVTLTQPDLELDLERGTLYLLRTGKRPHGAVFVGRGTVRFTPPEGVERDQLRKFTKSDVLEESFERVLLYFSDPSVARQLTVDAKSEVDKRAAREAAKFHHRRLEHLEERRGTNLIGYVLRDFVDGDLGFFAAEIDTAGHGVVSYRHDPLDAEPVRLEHWSKRFGGFLDTWCSYTHSAFVEPVVRVRHYEIDVRLDGHDIDQVDVRATVESSSKARVVAFGLHPRMELKEVRSESGGELFFVRERMKGDDIWSAVVFVFFDEPLEAEQVVSFEISGDIVEDFHGGQYGITVTTGWYPLLGHSARSTFALSFDVDERYKVFASAQRLTEVTEDGRTRTTWARTYPVPSVAFQFGDMPVAEIELDGLPPVTVLGREKGFVPGDRVREVGTDVARGIEFFSERFGDYEFESMYATRIPYDHGEGFPGLLHLSAQTFGGGWRGVDEAFRAHEVAHQWWGHMVGRKSYRDLWMSEGFSVYSGALYAVNALADPELLSQMLQSWRNDIIGTGNVAKSLGLSKFGMSRELMKHSKGSDAGPISLGIRLRSSLGPFDYRVLVYEKGAWVLHMLRMLLRDLDTGSDEAFFAMMRDFVTTHRGSNAETSDFQAIVTRHANRDMTWFFDQWVGGTHIPRYRHAWRAEFVDGAHVVRLRIEQELEDGQDFKMSIPIRIGLESGREIVRRVEVAAAVETFTIAVDARPTEVGFNDLDAVLCHERSVAF